VLMHKQFVMVFGFITQIRASHGTPTRKLDIIRSMYLTEHQ
jgi:hypothetical protein